jgi:SAM-dependent methyltransferase
VLTESQAASRPQGEPDVARARPGGGPASGPLGLVRSLLGIRRSFTIEGVKYKELSAEPLWRALSRRGSGQKEYAVSFAGGRKMRIVVTPTRAYADLTGPVLLDEYRLAEAFIRPGMRVAALRSGTGYAGAWLSAMVGPSGSVVALDDDAEAIRYARRRYRLENVAFEVGGHEALAGEIDGAFDAVVAVRALRTDDDAAAITAELWRALSPGGGLMMTARIIPSEPGDKTRVFGRDELATLLETAARQGPPHGRRVPKPAEPESDPKPETSARTPSVQVLILETPPGVVAAVARKAAEAG